MNEKTPENLRIAFQDHAKNYEFDLSEDFFANPDHYEDPQVQAQWVAFEAGWNAALRGETPPQEPSE